MFLLFGFLHFQKAPFYSTIAVAVSGFILASSLSILFAGDYCLQLTRDGLRLKQGAADRFVRWADIKIIRIGWYATGYMRWTYPRQIFVNYRQQTKDQILMIYPGFFGVSVAKMVSNILPYCVDYPRLSQTMRADSEKNGVPLVKTNGTLSEIK